MKWSATFSLLLLSALFGSSLSSPVFDRSASSRMRQSLALVGAKIYPSPTGKSIADGVVLIEHDRITAVGENGKIKIPPGIKVVDCSGLTLTSGFWNSHVHFTEPKWHNAVSLSSAQLTQQLREMLTRYGFTTVFDTGSSIENTKVIRQRVEAGEAAGPRILTTGEPIYPKDGIPIYVRELKIKLPEVATQEQATSLAREKVGGGADAIKIFAASWVGGDRVVTMPTEVMRALTAEAHRHGKLAIAHPQSAAGIQAAVESRVDVLAHTAPDSGEWSNDLLTGLKKSGIALIPTLKLWRVEAQKAGKSSDIIQRFQNLGVAQLRAYSRVGGQILFGTDVGYITDYDTADEYLLMAQAGMSFQQILASLTTAPAERFGMSGRVGRIAAGMDADIVLLAGDPATDIRNFSNLRYTIRKGKVIYQSE